MPAGSGRYPSGQRGQTVNLLAYAFGGSNPPLPTTVTNDACTGRGVGGLFEEQVAPTRPTTVQRVAPTCAMTDRMAMEPTTVSFCGNSSAVERQPSKLGVAGSNPVSRSMRIRGAHGVAGGDEFRAFGDRIEAPKTFERAHVAQSAERVLGKDEVSGSNPDMGSRIRAAATAAGRRR